MTTNPYRRAKALKGICYRCVKPAVPGKFHCQECLEKGRETAKKAYSRLKFRASCKPDYWRRRFHLAKKNAKVREIEWTLTPEEYYPFSLMPCYYCGSSAISTGSGLDRKDNTKGYISGNVVSCCKRCNRIKCDLLTHEEMIVAMKSVIAFRSLCNVPNS